MDCAIEYDALMCMAYERGLCGCDVMWYRRDTTWYECDTIHSDVAWRVYDVIGLDMWYESNVSRVYQILRNSPNLLCFILYLPIFVPVAHQFLLNGSSLLPLDVDMQLFDVVSQYIGSTYHSPVFCLFRRHIVGLSSTEVSQRSVLKEVNINLHHAYCKPL